LPASNPRTSNVHGRRNRAALRDYYGLKGTGPPGNASPTDISRSSSIDPSGRDGQGRTNVSALDTLDREGFDAGAYVRQVLEIEPLQSLLGLENELVSDIKNLDGERKALVYDNYSKLITATDTIKKVSLKPWSRLRLQSQMRTNMDPLSPATSTLSPAISHIAETAASFAKEMAKSPMGDSAEAVAAKSKSRSVVQWALEGPERLKSLIDQGNPGEAHDQWVAIQKLLDRWGNVKGCAELRSACAKAVSPQGDWFSARAGFDINQFSFGN
jgi:hypothetical protein